MGRFDHLATRPSRGPRDILRWKVLDAVTGKNRKDPGGYATPRREPDRSLVEGAAPQLTWIGHASFLLTLGGKRILVDPIFSHRLGPVARLTPPGLALDALPPPPAGPPPRRPPAHRRRPGHPQPPRPPRPVEPEAPRPRPSVRGAAG